MFEQVSPGETARDHRTHCLWPVRSGGKSRLPLRFHRHALYAKCSTARSGFTTSKQSSSIVQSAIILFFQS